MKKAFLIILALIFAFSMFSTSILTSAETVDKSELFALVSEAEKINKNNYANNTIAWKMFEMKLNEARELLDRNYVTQDEIAEMVFNLQYAINSLGEPIYSDTESVDKSELEALIAEAFSWEASDFKKITVEQWVNFQDEIKAARYTLQSKYASQEDVDAAKNNLVAAMDAMRALKNIDEFESAEVTELPATQTPPVQTDIVIKPINPNDSATVVGPNSSTAKPATETRPKSTTPFLQGGFIEIGCDATVALSALVIVGIIGAAVAIKKKED